MDLSCNFFGMVMRLPPGTSIFPVIAANMATAREVDMVSAFCSIDTRWVIDAGLVVAKSLAAFLILCPGTPTIFSTLSSGYSFTLFTNGSQPNV